MHNLNPVSRLLQLAQTSEVDFRETFGFSKQFMVDVTEGTYTQLSTRLHAALKDLSTAKGLYVSGILRDDYEGSLTLDEAYDRWQRWQRIENRDIFLSTRPKEGTKDLSPAHFFVKETAKTPTTFSKKLKVPPQSVRDWVNGKQRKPIPGAIRAALYQLGYPYLAELQAAQGRWLGE